MYKYAIILIFIYLLYIAVKFAYILVLFDEKPG